MRRLLTAFCLSALLVGVAGCALLPSRDAPQALVDAHAVETKLLVAYNHDITDFANALIDDKDGMADDAERDEARAKLKELTENYEDALRVRAVVASWMGVLDAFLELTHD